MQSYIAKHVVLYVRGKKLVKQHLHHHINVAHNIYTENKGTYMNANSNHTIRRMGHPKSSKPKSCTWLHIQKSRCACIQQTPESQHTHSMTQSEIQQL